MPLPASGSGSRLRNSKKSHDLTIVAYSIRTANGSFVPAKIIYGMPAFDGSALARIEWASNWRFRPSPAVRHRLLSGRQSESFEMAIKQAIQIAKNSTQ